VKLSGLNALTTKSQTAFYRVLATMVLAVSPSRVVDADGRTIRFRRWEILGALNQHSRRMASGHRHEPFRRIVRTVSRSDLVFILGSLIGIPLIAILLLIRNFGSLSNAIAMIGYAVICGLFVATKGWFIFARPGISDRLANSISTHGRCAACGHSLHGLPMNRDALIQCPECGARWKAINT
jgi:DNA-directed RNA polymerase subunit RPC12/RpoP/carbon starvation protein CstA